MKTKVLFICHGNICRSPMAEYIFKKIIREKGLEDRFEVASAATSREELGNPIYPPARRILEQYNVPFEKRAARQMTAEDYRNYDYLVVMDDWNVRNACRITGGDPDGKISKLMDYTDHPGDVSDPWYSDDFEGVYRDIKEGCTAFLVHLKKAL